MEKEFDLESVLMSHRGGHKTGSCGRRDREGECYIDSFVQMRNSRPPGWSTSPVSEHSPMPLE